MTATGTKIDEKSRLAGMTALCSANPYPVITIGDGENNPETRTTKCINERDNSMDGELSPAFWRLYELDALFPDDWKL